MDSNSASAMGTVPAAEFGAGLATRFRGWVKDPFTKDMDLVQWFLFIGLIVVASAMWQSILKKIG